MDIVFARHRQRYDSYHDFWQLVALSGFQSCYLDEVDVRSDHFYVALTPFNDELWQLAMQRNLHPDRRGRIAFWSLERPAFPGAGTTTEVVTRALQCADRVWVSDRWYQQLDPRQQHVIFGSHPNLQPLAEPRPRIFDYCHVSYVNPRRARILRTLRDAGLSEAPARGPGPERDQLLRSSAVL